MNNSKEPGIIGMLGDIIQEERELKRKAIEKMWDRLYIPEILTGNPSTCEGEYSYADVKRDTVSFPLHLDELDKQLIQDIKKSQ